MSRPRELGWCEDCHFCQPMDSTYAECRLAPPAVIRDPEQNALASAWPMVFSDQWCEACKSREAACDGLK